MQRFIEPSDLAADADTNCQICGRDVVEDCICPECPMCQVSGDPACILEHGYGPIVTAAARERGIKVAWNAVFHIERESKHLEWQLALNRAVYEIETAGRTGQETVETTLKLYVWENFAPDFSTGLAFALARDGDEARDMIAADGNDYLRMYLGEKPKVYEWDTLETPLAFFVTGSS